MNYIVFDLEWNQAAEGNQAEDEAGTGESVGQPAHGNLLHPGSQHGHRLADEIQPVVAMAQGARALRAQVRVRPS